MQQEVRPANGPIQSVINIPGSSQITLRALLLAALANGVSEISNIHMSVETATLVNNLHQLGIVTQLDEESQSCIVAGGNGQFPRQQGKVWCDNADSIEYYFMTACAAAPGVYFFDALPELRNRSGYSLLKILLDQGIQLIPDDARNIPLTLIGADKLKGGEIVFSETVNSEMISSLLMIAPFTALPVNFILPDYIKDTGVEITLDLMADFGVQAHRSHDQEIFVPAPQHYQSNDYVVEPDLALATWFFAAAAITAGEITIQHTIRSRSKQAGIKFLTILEKMGCRVYETNSGLTIKGSADLQGIDVDLDEISDTFMALTAIAPFATSPVHISYGHDISKSEIEKISIMKKYLEKMEINVETGNGWIHITPGIPSGCTIETHGHPQIGMAFALIGLKAPNVIIDGAECVEKNYPTFFTMWDSLIHTNVRA